MSSPTAPWFSTDRLDADTYALSEYGHCEQTHQYLFIGDDRAALVDSGLGVADIHAVVSRLTDRPITVLTTHAHWDHVGGHSSFAEIAVHAADAGWLEHGLPVPLPVIRENFRKEHLTRQLPEGFDADRYVPFTGRPSRILRDGDTIDLGGRVLMVLHTPGHSPGHLCVYEPKRGYLVTGDLLYEGRLDAYYPSTDPLQFARSIARVAALPGVVALLPGHHRLDIPTSYLAEADNAFESIAARGQLRHGTGVHRFTHFSIRL
jgi:glyoxylase-like metal-dependent hydrolase (beta-lactamase superfamily II)